MDNVLLVHYDKDNSVLHYRADLYNYFFKVFSQEGLNLHVISAQIKHEFFIPSFKFHKAELSVLKIVNYVKDNNIKKVIIFMNMGRLRIFPLMFALKLLGVEIIYWGHGADLQDPKNPLKPILYWLAFFLSTKIVVYNFESVNLYVPKIFRNKSFFANNSIVMDASKIAVNKNFLKDKYGIDTEFNVVVVGRIQKRKRVDVLCEAVSRLASRSIGLIVIGPVEDENVERYQYFSNIYLLGAMFGSDKNTLIANSDLYCLPGTVGLSVIEPLFFGKPVITCIDKSIRHSPEFIYLKNGVNCTIIDGLSSHNIESAILSYKENEILLREHSISAGDTYCNEASHVIMANQFVQALNKVI